MFVVPFASFVSKSNFATKPSKSTGKPNIIYIPAVSKVTYLHGFPKTHIELSAMKDSSFIRIPFAKVTAGDPVQVWRRTSKNLGTSIISLVWNMFTSQSIWRDI